jgi:hypothetical protein
MVGCTVRFSRTPTVIRSFAVERTIIDYPLTSSSLAG